MKEFSQNIDISSCEDIECECGNMYFNQAIRLKRISALQSPTGKEGGVVVPVFLCTKCGKPLGVETN